MTIRMVIVLVIGIYTSRVLLHTLGVEDFGIYNVVCGFVSMFAFLNTSMNNGIQRYYNYELGINGEDGARKVYHCSIITQITIAIIVIVLTESIGLWYVYNKLVVPVERFETSVWIFHSAVASLLFLIIQIPYSAAIMAHEKMDYYAICSVLDIMLKLLIVLALPYIGGDNLKTYGLLIIAVSIIDFAMYFVYARRKFPELRGKYKFERGLFREMVRFSGWNLFGSFAGVMKEQGLNVILNLFFGPVVNAARGLAYQVSGGVQSFIINITTAARPQLTQSYAQGNTERTINIMYSMSKMSYLCLYMLALPVMMEVDFLLKLWLGNQVPEHTNSFVILVVGYTLVNVFNAPTSFVVHATGKMKKYQLISSVWGLLLLPASYFALYLGTEPEFVFVLNIIFMVIGQVISVIILRSLIVFSVKIYLYKVILSCALLSIFSAIPPIVTKSLIEEGFVRFVIVSLVSSISIACLSYIIVFNIAERQILKGLVYKIIKR